MFFPAFLCFSSPGPCVFFCLFVFAVFCVAFLQRPPPVPRGKKIVRQLVHVNGVEADELTLDEVREMGWWRCTYGRAIRGGAICVLGTPPC